MEAEPPPQQERRENGQEEAATGQEAGLATPADEQPAVSAVAVETGHQRVEQQAPPPPAASAAPSSKQKKPPACQVCGVDLSECRVFFRVSPRVLSDVAQR